MLDYDHGVALLTKAWSTSGNLRTSSKWRPVVGSSRMERVLPVARRRALRRQPCERILAKMLTGVELS